MVTRTESTGYASGRRPLIAITARRLGETDRWPYSRAVVAPRGYIESVERGAGCRR